MTNPVFIPDTPLTQAELRSLPSLVGKDGCGNRVCLHRVEEGSMDFDVEVLPPLVEVDDNPFAQMAPIVIAVDDMGGGSRRTRMLKNKYVAPTS